MIKQVNWVLSKGQEEAIQLHSQRTIKPEGEQMVISRTVSSKSISVRRRQEEYVVKQPTKEQKVASLFVRNIIRQFLRKPFKMMLSRLVIKKTAYKLLTSKRKRDLQAAFLSIKDYKIKTQHSNLQNFFSRHTELRILCQIIKKKESQNQQYSFNCIKDLAIRTNKLRLLLLAFDQSVSRSIKRLYYSHFFTKLRENDVCRYEQSLKAIQISKISQFSIKNATKEAFNKIIDSILIGECENTSQIKKNKHEEFASMNATKKQQLVQIREQLKAIKTNIDQQKVNKNRVFQQRKKVNNTNKTTMVETVRKFDKQFKEEAAITKDIEQIYNIRQRVMSVRGRLRESSKGSQQLCLNLIKAMSPYGERIKSLSQSLPQIDTELSKFKQSEVYLLKANSLLQKRVENYEKRQPYSYESEYYELEYQNNVIRAMISCFIREQQYDAINHFKKGQSSSEAPLQALKQE